MASREVKSETKDTDRAEFRFKIFDRGVAAVSAMSIIVSGVFGLISYNNQRKIDSALKKREFQLSVYREKKEIYYPLCESAAAIVSCTSQNEAKPHIKDFLTLYYGKAHLIAIDLEVNNAKVDFRAKLNEWVDSKDQKPPPKDLINLALNLTESCRECLDPATALAD
jgi:hypothetical protein